MAPAWRVFGRSVAISAALVGVTSPSGAMEWRWTPRVALEQAYSDNVDLDPPGREESDFSTSATLGISGSGNGNRFDLNLNYAITRIAFWKDSDRGDFRHNLTFTTDSELIEQFLFFDARASASEEFINNEGAVSGSNFNATGNRDTVASFSAGPTAVWRIGEYSNAALAYNFSTVVLGDTDDGGDIHDVTFDLTDGLITPRLGWSFSTVYSRFISQGDDPSDKRAFADFTLTYAIHERWTVNGTIGYEIIDNSGLIDEPKGATWSVGTNYRPSPKTNLNLSFGWRFDDYNVGMSARYSPTPRTTFVSTFSQSLTNTEQRRISNLGAIFVDENGDFLDDRTGLPFDPTEPGVDFSSALVRQDTFRVTAFTSRDRNNYSLSAFLNQQSDERQNTDEIVFGATAGFGRSLTHSTRANVNLTYRNTDFDTADGRQDDLYTADLVVNYRLASDISTTFTYSYTLRESNVDANDLEENALAVRLTKTF